MNQQHGRFAIANRDFLYVLSTFIFEPIRWNERFGWRSMCDKERLACFYFWREIGRRMSIENIPTDYAVFETFNRDYEKTQHRFTQANRRVGSATRELFVSWFPRTLAPLVRKTIHALLDDSLIEAFGFERPSPFHAEACRRRITIARRSGGSASGSAPPAAAHQDSPPELSEGICDRRTRAARRQINETLGFRARGQDWQADASLSLGATGK